MFDHPSVDFFRNLNHVSPSLPREKALLLAAGMIAVSFSADTGFNPLRQRLRGECSV
jgi:hypothetical protein